MTLSPQLKNRDTHHVHERSDRFVIHEWEGLRNVFRHPVETAQVLMYLTTYTKIGTLRPDIPKICGSTAEHNRL